MSPGAWLVGSAAILAVAGGLGVAATRSVVHGALFLILALLAVAGMYLALAADFIALVQVLLYGGAVSILILFAMMLTQPADQPASHDRHHGWAALTALLLFAAMVFGIHATPWPGLQAAALTQVDFTRIAASLFTTWAVPFEVASLILLVALVGAVIVARRERDE